MNGVRQSDIERAIDTEDCRSIRVVYNGPLTVLAFEDRVFLYNRGNRKAYELKPDFEYGVTVHALY